MTTRDLASLTVSELNVEFLEKRLTPNAFLEFCFTQIKAKNPTINAVLELYRDEAIEAAKAATDRFAKGESRSALDGIPIGVKANISVKGQVCHGGIKAYENNVATRDAEVVRRLREGGAIILGSLNMEEGALGAQTDNPWFGKTHNPLKHGYTPGGSSGGSAAAVAAGMLPIALGTDTMGSVRIPSAYCGLVGYKPSAALIPMDGIMPLSTTLDTVGPHTKSIQDAAILFEVVTGQKMSTQGYGVDFGYFEVPDEADIDADIRTFFETIIAKLKMKLSSEIFEGLNLPGIGYDFGSARRKGLLISEIEGEKYHRPQHKIQPDGFSKHFWGMLEWGVNQSKAKQDATFNYVENLRAHPRDSFLGFDYVIGLTTLQAPFKFGQAVPVNQADFTAVANLYGVPAISFPVTISQKGWPLSLQLVGVRGRDSELFATAKWILEQLRD